MYTKRSLRLHLQRIEGWLSVHEAYLLYELARRIPVHGEIVEIGSYKGRSTVALAYGFLAGKNKGYVWAIDPHEGLIAVHQRAPKDGTYQEFQKNIRAAGVEDCVHAIVATSKQAAKNWKHPIRLLFIDGLHDAVHTLEDYRLWSRWVQTDGGVIAFHDGFCGEAGVWQVIRDHVFKRKDIVDIGTTSSILYVMLGKSTRVSRWRVFGKRLLVRLAQWLSRQSMPRVLKNTIIHKLIRLFLITRYTWSVYRGYNKCA
ncbi:MAG: class I SAM-dependent methyltransferase [Patescibacteria group bacterium]|nr:class I SAM-dependent methyltransferase [Patescibacteria group bacterium]